tara:strand:- start:2270 stop:2500 length:231 start_codon:yes stop_codon:yes gene_type:complete
MMQSKNKPGKGLTYKPIMRRAKSANAIMSKLESINNSKIKYQLVRNVEYDGDKLECQSHDQPRNGEKVRMIRPFRN